MSSNPPPNPPQVEMILPTDQESAEGRANLERCFPYWETAPGLLIIKPHLAAIVTVSGHQSDAAGFTLTLRLEEALATGPSGPPEDLTVSCLWNQPYMSFDPDVISAPYCFTLYFGAQGVEYARETREILVRRGIAEGMGPTIYGGCFEFGGTEFMQSLRAMPPGKTDA